jgi:hypothetical protein
MTEELVREVGKYPYWFHSVDLGGGLVASGAKTPLVHPTPRNSTSHIHARAAAVA